MNKASSLTLFCFTSTISAFSLSSDYPFTLPDSITATIHVNTTQQTPFNNLLLGTNIFGYESVTEKALIRQFDPITIRFPHGLWANWYDWRTDTTRVFGEETFEYTRPDGSLRTQKLDHLDSIKLKEASGSVVGIDGLEILHADKKLINDVGYDLLWTFNMSADGTDFNNGSTETLARYDDLIARGFTVKAIELGNENFYPGQRSSIIPNTEDYLKRAKSMSLALKARDPNIKLSIPLLRRESVANPDWNADLTVDQQYFDAVTVHTYVGSDPDDANSPEGAYGTALTARFHLANSINEFAMKVAPTKPIWLTEWGVKSGGPNAVSVLGMADSYIYMSQHQNIYERANWFSVNGQLNSFLVWEDYVSPSGVIRPRIKYPLEKTAVGATYELVRQVFEDSTLLASTMTSPELISDVNAISARAVVKDGKTIVFALNLTDKPAAFDIDLNGEPFSGNHHHQALTFSTLSEEHNWPITENVLTLINDGAEDIVLPRLSISIIELMDTAVEPVFFTVDMVSPADNSNHSLGSSLTLSADANSSENDIKQVNFLVNGNFLKQDNTAPYAIDWTPTEVGDYSIHAIAIKTDGTRLPSTSRTVSVYIPESVTMVTPMINAEFNLGDLITLEASVTSSQAITKVNFHVNGTFFKQTSSAPFKTLWQPETEGPYTVSAIVVFADGSKLVSSDVNISVVNSVDPVDPVDPATNVASDNSVSPVRFKSGAASPMLIGIFGIGLLLTRRRWAAMRS